MQKRIVTIFVAAMFALGSGLVAAQSRGGGGGMHGGMGGGWSGGAGGWSGGAGGWHGGGGSWNGGGGGWHGGGGSWNGGWHGGGGSWNNGWHGGWNTGWRGGCWNCGWRGNTWVGVSFGLPGTWWWPGVAPVWGGWGWGWGPQVVSTPTFVDQGPVVFIQRDQVVDGAYSSAPPARSAPANEFWHYCIDPPGYFPQVQQCNKEWLKVVPNNNSRPAPGPQYQ